MLKQSHDIISEGLINNRSDGLVRPEEAEWGKYIMTFEHDHLEMGGLNPNHFPINIYNLLTDNIRLNEVMKNKEESFQYGVENLF